MSSRPEEKRRAVLEATIQVLARVGPRGVTHRAVAAEAGTSLRATTYYFASRDELLTEALRHYANTAIERIDALLMPLAEDFEAALEGAARMLALTVLSDLTDDRAGLVAEYELVLEIARNPALESTYRDWQQRLEDILIVYGERFGARDPAGDARLVLATLRGLEIEALARPSAPAVFDDLQRLFERLLRSLHGAA